MTDPNFILLYVADTAASTRFYTDLLGKKPAEASENFAMFALGSGVMLGLWKTADVQPAATPAGGVELGFPAPSADAVNATHRHWTEAGIRIVQAPVQMDFGYTFTAIDPDGHRLRVFSPGGA